VSPVRPPALREVGGLTRTSHGAIALALAGELGDVDRDAVDDALHALSRNLEPAARASGPRQLATTGCALRGRLQARTAAPAMADLRLDRVVLDGGGHPLLCAIAGIEAAHRAGIELGLVASNAGAFVGAQGVVPWLLSPAQDWTVVDARELGSPDLAWFCPHEAAALVVGLVEQRVGRLKDHLPLSGGPATGPSG
jgi:hypothetical protein